MTTKRPIAIRPALALISGPDATDPARAERDHEPAAALWLYAWSYDALRPTGELLAARLTTPAVASTGQESGPHLAPKSTSADLAIAGQTHGGREPSANILRLFKSLHATLST